MASSTITTTSTKVKRNKHIKKVELSRKLRRRSSLLCFTDDQIRAFGFRFQQNSELPPKNAEMDITPAMILGGERLSSGGDIAMGELTWFLRDRGVNVWGLGKLEFLTSRYKLTTASNGVFSSPATDQVIATADCWQLQMARKSHARRRDVPYKLRDREEQNLTPANEEHDPQIAGVLAALAQEKWRSGHKEVPGVRVHVIWPRLLSNSPCIARGFQER